MDTKRYTRFVAMSLVALSLAGCATAATPAPTAVPPAPTAVPATPKPALDLPVLVDKYVKGLPDGFSGIAPAALSDQLKTAKPFIIDVREPDEFSAEHIAYASSLPLALVRDLFKIMDIPEGRKVLFQCKKGGRGGQACIKAKFRLVTLRPVATFCGLL